MPAAMLGKRFLERENRKFGAAWHKITDPITEDISATESWRRIGGQEGIVITQEGLSVPRYPDLVVPEKLLVRHPTFDDPQYRSFGVVTDEYQIVEYGHICRLWDEHLALPVETHGLIHDGRCMFLTGNLEPFRVKDETLLDFVVCNSWFDASGAIKLFQTGVREVCANTVRAAESVAGGTMYRVVHDRNALANVAAWMANMAARLYPQRELFAEACNLLAGRAVTDEGGFAVLEAAYPAPREPMRDAPEEIMAGRWERYEAQAQIMLDRRIAAAELFDGAGTGMTTQAAMGTYWGLYQSIVELEDYRRGGTDQQAAISSFIGPRAETKERAFTRALEAARN